MLLLFLQRNLKRTPRNWKIKKKTSTLKVQKNLHQSQTKDPSMNYLSNILDQNMHLLRRIHLIRSKREKPRKLIHRSFSKTKIQTSLTQSQKRQMNLTQTQNETNLTQTQNKTNLTQTQTKMRKARIK